jgi:hypothetical protein
MKQLTKTETKQLASLLKRAIHHNQLALNVASPITEKEKAGEFNDNFDGNSTNCEGGWVGVEESQTYAAMERYEDDFDQPSVAIYIPQRALDFLNP